MAPEVLMIDKSYTSKCDMWSVGCIAYMLITGNMAFDSSENQDSSIYKKMHESIRTKIDSKVL